MLENLQETVTLSAAQYDFVSTDEIAPLMCCGLGAGKTEAGMWRAIRLKMESPDADVAYYLPTYQLVEDIIMQRFPPLLDKYPFGAKVSKDSPPHIKFPTLGSGRLVFRSMDNPDTIIGYQTADAIIDELDTLPTDKARLVHQKILQRNRVKKPNGKSNTIGVCTTPEGFRFCYQMWEENKKPGYRIIRAATASNPYVTPEYIQSLRDTLTPEQQRAYIDGEFVNTTSGSVYTQYERVRCRTREKLLPHEPVHVGADFNVGKGSAVVCVMRDGKGYALEELTRLKDTPHFIEELQLRYYGRSIIIYPDASGASRKSVDASKSDIELLRRAGFQIVASKKNPYIKDRVMAVQHAFKNLGFKVNDETCPTLANCLEKQSYDKYGDPSKDAGYDHLNDALGYLIYQKFPILNRVVQFANLAGF